MYQVSDHIYRHWISLFHLKEDNMTEGISILIFNITTTCICFGEKLVAASILLLTSSKIFTVHLTFQNFKKKKFYNIIHQQYKNNDVDKVRLFSKTVFSFEKVDSVDIYLL